MMKNRRATLLIELTVLILASFIIFESVAKVLSSQNQVIERMTENNDVLLMFDSISNYLKYNHKNKQSLNLEKLNEIFLSDNNSRYYLDYNGIEEDKVEIILCVRDLTNNNVKRYYKQKVSLNE